MAEKLVKVETKKKVAKLEEEKTSLPKGSIRSKKVLNIALTLASNGGENTVVYNISGKTPLVSYTILTSAGSSKRMNGLAARAKESLIENGFSINHVEGKRESEWLLVDANNVVVHIFSRNERDRIDLDSLYKGCPKTTITEDNVIDFVSRGVKK